MDESIVQIGQKINELNEDLRQLTQEVAEAMSDNTLQTAPVVMGDYHKILLSLGKAITEIGKAYSCYQSISTK